jgi:hypothetical protein
VTLQLESSEPVAIEASFTPDVAWMWPAGLGAGYVEWDSTLRVFNFGEEEHRFYAFAGSPEASDIHQAYSTNYSSATTDGFQFGPAVKGPATYHFVLAASFKEKKGANDLYQKLLSQYPQLQQDAREYDKHYLDTTVSVSLPDRDLQTAYDWSRISEVQGLVDDSFVGTGLIAGYDLSGVNHRPGFSWFFGRDSMWTALALDSVGDFQNTRTALEFLAKYQGENGRIPHEVPQTVSLVPWFKLYPYGLASADATPLYIIGTADYVRASPWRSLERSGTASGGLINGYVPPMRRMVSPRTRALVTDGSRAGHCGRFPQSCTRWAWRFRHSNRWLTWRACCTNRKRSRFCRTCPRSRAEWKPRSERGNRRQAGQFPCSRARQRS